MFGAWNKGKVHGVLCIVTGSFENIPPDLTKKAFPLEFSRPLGTTSLIFETLAYTWTSEKER